jgi:hypothetical protein
LSGADESKRAVEKRNLFADFKLLQALNQSDGCRQAALPDGASRANEGI